MQWCHGFMLLSTEVDINYQVQIYLRARLQPFFSLTTHPSAVALPDVAFAFSHQIMWTLNQSHNCLNLAPVGFI